MKMLFRLQELIESRLFRRQRPVEFDRDQITINVKVDQARMDFGPVILVHQDEDNRIMGTDGAHAHAFGPFPTVAAALREIAIMRRMTADDCYKIIMPLYDPATVGEELDGGDGAEVDPMAVPEIDAEPVTGNGLGRIH